MWPDLTREAFLLHMYTNYKLISAGFAALFCLSPVLIIGQGSVKFPQSQNAGPENSPSGTILQNSCVLNEFIQNPTSSQKHKTKTASSKKMNVVITAYSSTAEETDSTPFITAQGTLVRDGIVANNLLPFGTRIKIPELYGNKIFTVEDRMNANGSKYHFDIWFPSHDSATDFGVKSTYIEILEI
jgi:3D (Asp-Asp-Asp) domain-containing protein